MVKSVYIHIPFCKIICSYCDFCKMYYNSKLINEYLDTLNSEIISKYNKKIIETIYIGGGTPNCLNDQELEKLFNILKQIKLSKKYEYTIECNIEYLTINQINLFKKYGINRVSIGIQTFNINHLSFLNRNHTKQEVFNKINLLKTNGIENINIDLIYALPNQKIEELNEDIDLFLKLKIPHISTYSLIIEPNTILGNKNINNIDEELDFQMYKLIQKKLKENGFIHYETSNFSKKGYESKHNLTYWNNDEYYGFGLGASGYINNIRYDNTRSINKYLNKNYLLVEDKIDLKKQIEYEFILGFRKIEGINIEKFNKKYNLNIFGIEKINKLLLEKKLLTDNKKIYINTKYIYVQNAILQEFID